MIPSYGKIETLGSKYLTELFDGDVVIQEKIDGSQFSAMVDGSTGQLHCASKSAAIDLANPQKLFVPAIEHIRSVREYLIPTRVYRFETLNRPKHNVLAYARVPTGNLVLLDVTPIDSDDCDLPDIADYIGVEPVQEIYRGPSSPAAVAEFLSAKPQLGGAMVEGVVIKNYAKGLKGKYVAPRFQEIMHGRPAKAPKIGIVQELSAKYRSEARWEKAVAHLRDADKLTNTAADIGLLIKEVIKDVEDECKEEILDALWNHHAKDLRNGFINGLPDWWKARV